MLHKMFSVIAIFTLLLTAAFTSKLNATDHGNSTNAKDIVETALDAGTFNTLATALTEAGLVDALKGDGPFTVFAPTDAAFAKLSKATLAALLANKTQLTSVLTYHVVPSIVMSTDLKNGMMVKTLQGENLTIKLANGGVMVNNATVVQADISSLNGVIHAIDTVLMPK